MASLLGRNHVVFVESPAPRQTERRRMGPMLREKDGHKRRMLFRLSCYGFMGFSVASDLSVIADTSWRTYPISIRMREPPNRTLYRLALANARSPGSSRPCSVDISVSTGPSPDADPHKRARHQSRSNPIWVWRPTAKIHSPQ